MGRKDRVRAGKSVKLLLAPEEEMSAEDKEELRGLIPRIKREGKRFVFLSYFPYGKGQSRKKQKFFGKFFVLKTTVYSWRNKKLLAKNG